MKRGIAIVMVVIMCGCVGWTKAAGVHKASNLGFSVEMPDGWMKFSQGNAVLLSKDGVPLQTILLRRDAIDTDLGFTKKRFEPHMLPQEAADVYLDNERMNQAKLNFMVVRNMPAEMGGRQAFQVEYAYKTVDGLRVRTTCRGLVYEGFFYQITYTAADRHYYEKDIAAYEAMAKSFQLTSN